MKKFILFFLSICWLSACNDDVDLNISSTEETIIDNSTSNFSEEDVVKGLMRIKLKEEPKGQVAVRSVNGKVSTGIKALDGSASILKITRMERTFPYTEKYEERTRREGLNLWYDVWYSEEVATTRAVNEIEILDGIEIACPVHKVSTRAVTLPWNDPYLDKQWNFYNSGTENWQVAGADIRLADIWEQYNGNPNVIVAVVDEGVDVEHPDLRGNLWKNPNEIPGNGIDDDKNGYIDDVYGYNFVSNNSNITPDNHATHVAGIIGAVNNNGEGVCGIAGGNGNPNSGAKIMCCQMLDGYRDSQGAAAIKYAADNGAVICQNSWGYNNNSTIDPVDKEAIDYFIKYAGCDNDGNQLPDSPMKGGIVLFATNNNNSSNPKNATPADYEKVIGVAAIRSDYKKGSYSNYGDYIDICAPGGENKKIDPNNTVLGKEIYSTFPFGSYNYLYGVSMACPHVAGVAALVVEKYGVGKKGFTAEQLKEILLSTAYDVNGYNPNYIGQLGNGCVNATAALQAELPNVNTSSKNFLLRSNPITNGTLLFRVNYELGGNATVTIYNSLGNKVFRKNITVKQYVTTSLDINKLAGGYYTIEYECNGKKIKDRFIKY
ncbi:S8 family serine peptidase [Bacteroides sp.]|uniref:S8 family serine peptidase n=1 Tax=Bacteroides sp. TaxID=29523 RepID=UPI00261A124E|nr:S8 family serine peptidase [Bacteroides sp.]MDD3037116.1 S8 family serine peptidase [Bacteroides sp.]